MLLLLAARARSCTARYIHQSFICHQNMKACQRSDLDGHTVYREVLIRHWELSPMCSNHRIDPSHIDTLVPHAFQAHLRGRKRTEETENATTWSVPILCARQLAMIRNASNTTYSLRNRRLPRFVSASDRSTDGMIMIDGCLDSCQFKGLDRLGNRSVYLERLTLAQTWYPQNGDSKYQGQPRRNVWARRSSGRGIHVGMLACCDMPRCICILLQVLHA